MYVPRTAPAGVGEEAAHRVGHGKTGFLPAGRFLGGWSQCWRWRRVGRVLSVAKDTTNTTTLNSASATRKLSRKERAGITLKALCSAPRVSIVTQARKTQAMAGIPTMIRIIKIFPFMPAKHLLSLTITCLAYQYYNTNSATCVCD